MKPIKIPTFSFVKLAWRSEYVDIKKDMYKVARQMNYFRIMPPTFEPTLFLISENATGVAIPWSIHKDN